MIFIRITRVWIVKHFIEIILCTFGFLFHILDGGRTSEYLSMEICSLPLMAPSLIMLLEGTVP